MAKPLLVVLTGAGISAESGLKTFRDSIDGLWNGYDIEEVATPEAWQRNPQLVLQFYNHRRSEVLKAKPNAAHYGLAALEQFFDLYIITQNIDDLHERAGSKNVLHLHGEILKMCSEKNKSVQWPIDCDMEYGATADDGGRLRPFIVWFGEEVPMMQEAMALTAQADAFAVIGTSLQVYPAAGLLHYTSPGVPVYLLDKKLPNVTTQGSLHAIEAPAAQGIDELIGQLRKHFKV